MILKHNGWSNRPGNAIVLTAVSPTIRLIWVVVGLLSTTLGFVGVVLPLLPTVPFMIFAAFCFAKGSPQLHF